jgi:outer membrane protein assembly factor BamE (lipoprotein component of BamABCDE complex)
MKKLVIFAALAIVMGGLAACQTDRLKEISSIENGMNKSEVLDRAGGPQRSDRKGDEDQWIYIVPEHRRDVTKEVRFREGRVSYVGDPIAPKGPSADEQDRMNEASNAKSEAARRRDQLLEDIGGQSSHPAHPSSAQEASPAVDDTVESKPVVKPQFVPLDGGRPTAN